MCKTGLSVLIFCISLHHVHQHKITDVETKEPVKNFDFLVFSQLWPISSCKTWIHEMNGTECAFPIKKNQWTVHGIWPWSVDAWKFPRYCNNSWAFDPEQIKSIKGELEQAWTNTYIGTDPYNFWVHEWMKHGTCATELEEFNSQFKYFSKGIEWNKKYSLVDMLEAAQIFPDDTKKINPEELINAVKTKTKKKPGIVWGKIYGVCYFSEIHLCLDKQLNLIDCAADVDQNDCLSEGIIFPANA